MRGLGQGRKPTLKRRALHAGQGALYRGAGRWWLRHGRAGHFAILMYHSVADAETAPWVAPRNRIEPGLFRRQMEYLARRRKVLALSEVVASLGDGRSLAPGSVVITFDDGYLDNLEVAAPILSELGLSATVFLCTSYLETGKPQWADRLYSAFRSRAREQLSVESLGEVRLAGAGVHIAYDALVSSLMSMPDGERDVVLEDIERQLGAAQDGPRRTLLWAEVEALRTRYPNIELGGHTSSHADLSSMAPEAAVAEALQCSRELEKAVGDRPQHFSFPYSRTNEAVLAELPKLGFRSAMVAVGGQSVLGDPMRLLRWEAPATLGRLAVLTSGTMPSLSETVLGRA